LGGGVGVDSTTFVLIKLTVWPSSIFKEASDYESSFKIRPKPVKPYLLPLKSSLWPSTSSWWLSLIAILRSMTVQSARTAISCWSPLD